MFRSKIINMTFTSVKVIISICCLAGHKSVALQDTNLLPYLLTFFFLCLLNQATMSSWPLWYPPLEGLILISVRGTCWSHTHTHTHTRPLSHHDYLPRPQRWLAVFSLEFLQFIMIKCGQSSPQTPEIDEITLVNLNEAFWDCGSEVLCYEPMYFDESERQWWTSEVERGKSERGQGERQRPM